MRILFLGGTSFVGRAIAKAAITAGHEATFFHRGITGASLFPGHKHIYGDRTEDVSVLGTLNADVVIDTSGYTPDSVAASARAVSDRADRYIFMSSIDAYDLSAPSIDETSPTRKLPEGASTSERSAALYGAHNARCETDLIEILGAERVLSVRAGLMIGPYDATDRFTYWPVRFARGGEILAPVGREMPVQVIDVRDVADWVVGSFDRRLSGAFNLVGTPGAITFGDVVDACQNATWSDGHLTWVSTEFLLEQGVEPWSELPLWLPDTPELRGLRNVHNARALATGLTLRPLLETARDVHADVRARASDYTMRAGLSPEREAELLAAWHALV
jgi:2'-hydroxyisoflavone reductase